jgi:hypothetical protein
VASVLISVLSVLSIDIMDISGEHQNDINHDISKTRLDKQGKLVQGAQAGRGLKGDLELVASAAADGEQCPSIHPRCLL